MKHVISSKRNYWNFDKNKLDTIYPDYDYSFISEVFVMYVMEVGLIQILLELLKTKLIITKEDNSKTHQLNADIVFEVVDFIYKFSDEFRKITGSDDFFFNLEKESRVYLTTFNCNDAFKSSPEDVNNVFEVFYLLNERGFCKNKNFEKVDIEEIRITFIAKFLEIEKNSDDEETAMLLNSYSEKYLTNIQSRQIVDIMGEKEVIILLLQKMNKGVLEKSSSFFKFIINQINSNDLKTILNSFDVVELNNNLGKENVLSTISKESSLNVV